MKKWAHFFPNKAPICSFYTDSNALICIFAPLFWFCFCYLFYWSMILLTCFFYLIYMVYGVVLYKCKQKHIKRHKKYEDYIKYTIRGLQNITFQINIVLHIIEVLNFMEYTHLRPCFCEEQFFCGPCICGSD